MLVERTPKREGLFWSKVIKIDDDDSCWLWTGATNCKGYGWITVYSEGKQRFFFVHKVSYEWEFGDIPEGQIIRHRCDTPLCVRPSHLIPGTHKQNMEDMVERGRHIGNRDINEITALEIRKRRALGETAKALGEAYGLSPQHVSNICTGKYWPDVGGPLTRRFEISDETILAVIVDLSQMSQVACAIKHGLSQAAVQQIASGKRKPRTVTSLVEPVTV